MIKDGPEYEQLLSAKSELVCARSGITKNMLSCVCTFDIKEDLACTRSDMGRTAPGHVMLFSSRSNLILAESGMSNTNLTRAGLRGSGGGPSRVESSTDRGKLMCAIPNMRIGAPSFAKL